MNENQFIISDSFFAQILNVVDPYWKLKLLGFSTDGASNMTGSVRGLATRLEQVALPGFIRVWCAVHQLDLVMQKTLQAFCENIFLPLLLGLISYLRRQHNLIATMKSQCPRLVESRWIASGKTLK